LMSHKHVINKLMGWKKKNESGRNWVSKSTHGLTH
jgi:hypothetical protein